MRISRCIARMLRNLKEVHHMQRDWQGLIAVPDRLVVLLPQAWQERRDRGLAHAENGLDVVLMVDRLHALRSDNG